MRRSFADAVTRAAHRPGAPCDRLADAGRQHVLQTLDWSISLDQLEMAYLTAKEYA